MNLEEQRRLGVKLAAGADAGGTLAAIKDTGKCFDEIFKTAASELGGDKLASILLENDPAWAFHALRALPHEFGGKREKLIARAASLHDNRIELNTEEAAAVSEAGFLGLKLIAGAAFECWFTMYWQNAPDGPIFPAAAESDNSKWKWSIKMSVNNSQWGDYCSDFSIPNAPVEDGATCWMVVAINGGGWYELKNYSFTYRKNSPALEVDTWGAVTNPQFGLPSKQEAEALKAAEV